MLKYLDMSTILSISIIIGLVFALIVMIYSIMRISLYSQKYIPTRLKVVNILLILFMGILYSIIFVLSTTIYFSQAINVMLMKISILMSLISFGLIAIGYNFLRQFKSILILPLLWVTVIIGLLIGSFFSSDSVNISLSENLTLHYSFSTITKLIVLFFQVSIVIYFFYNVVIIRLKVENKEISRNMTFFMMLIILPVLLYFFFFLTQIIFFGELHIIFTWILMIYGCFLFISRPEIFLVLTNKIYFLNVYHKSGVLLFSYQFKKLTDEISSAKWGSILIGLNHILSEFIDKSDKVDVLQTFNSEIVVNYNESLGFAVLVTTDKKNVILEEIMKNFTKDFQEYYKKELTEILDLNRMIDVSEFSHTREIIEKNFQIYL
ncbi:MAG: hypothetical protein ACFFDN_24955 [Candidatus Hodarchaeota archaeon]